MKPELKESIVSTLTCIEEHVQEIRDNIDDPEGLEDVEYALTEIAAYASETLQDVQAAKGGGS